MTISEGEEKQLLGSEKSNCESSKYLRTKRRQTKPHCHSSHPNALSGTAMHTSTGERLCSFAISRKANRDKSRPKKEATRTRREGKAKRTKDNGTSCWLCGGLISSLRGGVLYNKVTIVTPHITTRISTARYRLSSLRMRLKCMEEREGEREKERIGKEEWVAGGRMGWGL